MRDFVDGNARDRLDRAGVPRSLARGIRGLYLDEFVRDPDLSTAEAAPNVGANPNQVRKWRHRSEAFKQAEQKLRGADVEITPEPRDEQVASLMDRYERAIAVARDVGPGPYRGTENAIQHQRGSYTQARLGAQEAVSALRRLGISDPMSIPDEAEPQPRQRSRQRSPIDASGWLWPTSINPHLSRRPR